MGKQEIMNEIAERLGIDPLNAKLRAGSTELKEFVTDTAIRLCAATSDEASGLKKVELIQKVLNKLEIPWRDEFISTGDTITTEVFDQILAQIRKKFKLTN